MNLALCLLVAAAAPWPSRYNDGVSAYRSNDFTAATSSFEQALAAPDRALQQRAYYNLGNACYRQGEAEQAQAQQLWQRAVKSYESALALDPKDADAKFNLDFVKKKLEELEKKKQEQQQQQQDKQDQKQDQKKDDQQQQQQQKQQDQQQEQKEPQQQPQSQSERLDKQQAKALLDNLRENEQNWNFFPEVQMKDLKQQGPPVKDW
jgi:Ca-activated chloride channel homolog